MMSPVHALNLGLHLLAGSLALAIGVVLLARAKGTAAHRRWGRMFVFCSALVCLSALVGLLVFRLLPVFALLNVLVAYQLFGGWRAVRRRDAPLQWLDAAATLVAIVLALLVLPALPWPAPPPAMAALLALAGLVGYDLLRWLFADAWRAWLWRYEHAYKMIGTLSAMLSALAGNVARGWQPWSQLLPSLLGLLVVVSCFLHIHRQQRARRRGAAGTAGMASSRFAGGRR